MSSPYEPPAPGATSQPRPAETPRYGNDPGYGNGPGDGNGPGYGNSPGRPAQRNGWGTAALVLGILGVLTCWTLVGGILLGLLAVVFGFLGRGRARRGEASNGGSALAGLILGVIAIAASASLIAFYLSIANSKEGQQLQDCADAATSQAAADACAQQFQQDAGR